MNKAKVVFILLGLVFIALTHVGDTLYRDWAYANQVNDFGLADYLPSITGTITAVFLLIGLSKEPLSDAPRNACWVMVGCVIYEVGQPFLGTGVFDWQDIVAVITTGCVMALLLKATVLDIARAPKAHATAWW